MRMSRRVLLTSGLFALGGCAGSPVPSTTPDPELTPSPTPTVTPTAASTPTSTPIPTSTVTSTPRATTSAGSSPTPAPPSLKGDRRNAWAFAPLDDPSELVVEGSVPTSEAFSTSKVLVVAAFLQTVADGVPDRLSDEDRRLIRAALTRSDGDALIMLQDRIRGVGGVITKMLRGLGDEQTTAPDRLLGLMQWTVREQVRFLIALHGGTVVSRAASAFLLDQLHPVRAHAWGLGTIGATSYKGGWLRQGRVTRQFGLVDGYAVAVITDAVGPVVLQTDGDSAHVQQLNRLAHQLERRLAYNRSHS